MDICVSADQLIGYSLFRFLWLNCLIVGGIQIMSIRFGMHLLYLLNKFFPTDKRLSIIVKIMPLNELHSVVTHLVIFLLF